MNLPSMPIPWTILFSMLRMGIEMRFAQNYGCEMGFTPHPSPFRTLAIVTLSALFIIVVVTAVECVVSIATDSSTSEIRRTRATRNVN